MAARGFLKAFLGVVAAACLGLAAALVLLDPYDTGRLTPFPRAGVPEAAPRMANASRSRDPRFDAALLGNSTLQLLDPARLGSISGRAFVQLTTPGTGPWEQAAMAEHLFARRGEAMSALVLGLDRLWCDRSLERRTLHPFPFWLYDRSDLVYAASLFRADSLEFLTRRVRLLLGREKAARPDGYWNYETEPAYAAFVGRELELMPPMPEEGRAAAVRSLARILAAAPARTRIVLVHPPIYRPAGSAGGPAYDRSLAACKASLATVAAGRPRTAILDFWIDDETAQTRSLFFDNLHYRRPVAERIEEAIAAALRRLD